MTNIDDDILAKRLGNPVYFFAYGSNMGTKWLRRKCVVPQASAAALLEGYRMSFSLSYWCPGLFRGLATIEPEYGAVVHGVLHTITRLDLFLLDLSERTHLGLYSRKSVVVRLSPSQHRRAEVYVGRRTGGVEQPCARYLSKLLAGAQEFHLPDYWIEGLRTRAPDTLSRQELGVQP